MKTVEKIVMAFADALATEQRIFEVTIDMVPQNAGVPPPKRNVYPLSICRSCWCAGDIRVYVVGRILVVYLIVTKPFHYLNEN